jgi:tRNA nucleotidyltransferase (CCA-adding enzyme)
MLVGSAARGTWLRQERDIDIFILLPEELPREELEKQGLAVARKVAGKRRKELFAEHPYVTTCVDGFEVDLVPCYDVADPKKIRSAVDRSPHHNAYIQRHMTPELADEVLLLKQFMTGVGTYGAELKVQGFSGYLCELLILHHRSFKDVIAAASKWRPATVIDPKGDYPDPGEARALFAKQPLIFIDPVDPNRNVAAAVSLQNFATFIRACQDFMEEPDLRFFFPKPVPRLSARQMIDLLRQRGTTLYCIVFESPKVVPDILYPQLRKTERAIITRLAGAGFDVLRSDVWSNGQSIILLELAVAQLPRTRVHIGPPITVEVRSFIQKHLKRKFTGPFIDEAGRLAFEIEREQTNARQVLERALIEQEAFGKHVRESLAKGYKIYEGKQIARLSRDRKICQFLSEYLTRCLPWYR